MEMKKSECEREITKEDSIHTIVFTAGTFLLMVCLKHFLFEQQWRACVFLILNVILLAILFMSVRPSYFGSSRSSESESNIVEEVKNENQEKKMAPSCACSQEIEEVKECYQEQCWSTSSTHVHNNENEQEEEEEVEEEEDEENVPLLSKEELNERVEAFIAMFRQHLISDVKQATNLTPKIGVPCCC